MFLKGCEAYGLKSHDLFVVNDLYEHRNLYMVTNNYLFSQKLFIPYQRQTLHKIFVEMPKQNGNH